MLAAHGNPFHSKLCLKLTLGVLVCSQLSSPVHRKMSWVSITLTFLCLVSVAANRADAYQPPNHRLSTHWK